MPLLLLEEACMTPLIEVDDIITQIYQGPLERRPWQSFLSVLRLRMNTELTALSIRPGGKGVTPVVILDRGYTVEKADAEQTADDYSRLIHLDPLSNALKQSGDIFTIDEVISQEELKQNTFYQTLIKPAAIVDQLGLCFAEPNGWTCHIRLMNREGKPKFSTAEKRFLQALLPHLERALELYARLKHNQSEMEMFRDTLDRLTIGTLVFDGQGSLLTTNNVAHYIAERSGSLTINHQKITFSKDSDQQRFNQIINDALDWRRTHSKDSFVDILQTDNKDGSKLDILIRAVPATDRYQADTSPSVIVYVEDNTQHELAPEHIIEKLFGLTPTEAYLASLLANGFTLQEAATKLDITENTVRSYCKRIFAKMGINRQADLVRIILKSVALLA